MMKDTPEFKIPDSFLSKTTRATAQFLFEQAEKRLQETLETDKVITDRCYRLIGILTPTFIALLTFAASRIDKPDILTVILINSMAFVCYSIFEIYKSLFPKPLMLIGSDPEQAFEETLLENQDDNQVIAAHIWECKNYQERISHNRQQNSRRLKRTTSALNTLKVMVVVDVVMFASYLLFQLFVGRI